MKNLFLEDFPFLLMSLNLYVLKVQHLNGKLMGLQLCVYMCVCGFSFVISFFFVVNFPSLYKFLFFCGGVLRGTEREKSNKQNDERVREKEREKESERIIDDFFFFILFYCSLYGIFFIFISFSEFHFFSFFLSFAHQIILCFIFFSHFFYFFGYMIDYLEIRC